MGKFSSSINGFSVAITTFQNHDFLRQCLPPLLESDAVREIVVSDDCSDNERWTHARELIVGAASDAGFEPAVPRTGATLENPGDIDSITQIEVLREGKAKSLVLSRNASNLGGFRNKFVGVSACTQEWVLVLDADNIVEPPALRALASITDPQSDQVYCAPRLKLFSQESHNSSPRILGIKSQLAVPRFLSKTELTGHFFSRLLTRHSRYSRAQASFFLNTGNFLVHRSRYIETLRHRFEDRTFDPGAACSIAFATPWLIGGGSFLFVNGFEYSHRLHSRSYWVESSSRKKAMELEMEIRESFPDQSWQNRSAQSRVYQVFLSLVSLPRDFRALIARLDKRGRRALRNFARNLGQA